MATTSKRIIAAKTLVHLLALTPAAILAWQFYDVWKTGSDALGADPIAELEHRTGLWALRFLLITLAITPLRQLTGQPVVVRFRRMLACTWRLTWGLTCVATGARCWKKS
jgi:methionine sulfoxide reductase heme-binding subunit